MNLSRLRVITGLGWSYMLRTLERPGQIPHVLRNVLVRRAHTGETLNAVRFGAWLRHVGIDTVIDVGAHEGEFASGVLGVVPHCALYAFEPQAVPFARLERRLRRYRNAHAFNVALGSAPGRATLHASSFTKASSLLPMSAAHLAAFSWAVEGPAETVGVTRLDDVVTLDATRTVLLKIDVQGYEVEVLRGASHCLTAVTFVLVETSIGGTLYEGEARFHDVYEMLTQRGFEFAGAWDQMRDPRNGTPLQIDALFRRRTAA